MKLFKQSLVMEASLSMFLLKNIRWQNENCVLKAYCSQDREYFLQWRINAYPLYTSNAFV